jgi:hypothetical protein
MTAEGGSKVTFLLKGTHHFFCFLLPIIYQSPAL